MKKYFRFCLSVLLFIFPMVGKAEIKALSYMDYYNQGIELYEAGKCNFSS